MVIADPSALYDELLDLFTDSASHERLCNFRLSDQKQARLDVLLGRNRDQVLTDAERMELEEFERLEHLGRMLKAHLRQKQSQ